MMKRVHILIGVSLCVLAVFLCKPQLVHAQGGSNDFSIARRADVLLHRMDDDSGPSCDDDIPGAWQLEYFGTTNIRYWGQLLILDKRIGGWEDGGHGATDTH